MRLRILRESSADAVKKGEAVAERELRGHTNDPAGLYVHIIRGITYTQGVIVADEAYWQKMFTLWPNVTPEQKNGIFEKIAETTTRKLQTWQQTGQLQEGVMGAIGGAIGGAVRGVANWVGNQITNFAKFIANIKTVLDAGQGQQHIPGQPRQSPAVVYSRLNGESVVGFVDQCLVASQQNLEKQEAEEEAARSSASPPPNGSAPSPPQSAQHHAAPVSAEPPAAPLSPQPGSPQADGAVPPTPGRALARRV